MRRGLIVALCIIMCSSCGCAYRTVSTLDEESTTDGEWANQSSQAATNTPTAVPDKREIAKKEPGVLSVWAYEETAKDEITINTDGEIVKAKEGAFAEGTPAEGHQCYKYDSELGDIYEYRTLLGEHNRIKYSGLARSYIGCNSKEEKVGINLRVEGKCTVELDGNDLAIDCEGSEEERGKHINIVAPNSGSKLLEKYGVNITEQTTKRLSIKPTQEGLSIKGSEDIGGAVIGFAELNENDYWGNDSKYDQSTFVYIDAICSNVDIELNNNVAEVYADVEGERTLMGTYPREEETLEDEKSETE